MPRARMKIVKRLRASERGRYSDYLTAANDLLVLARFAAEQLPGVPCCCTSADCLACQVSEVLTRHIASTAPASVAAEPEGPAPF